MIDDDILEARQIGYDERSAELAEHIAFLESAIENARQEILRWQKIVRESHRFDQIFIEHIQAHLGPGQIVVCKICNQPASAIICAAIAAAEPERS